ncbi:MAG: DUF1003 domain-containing protein [Dokdonella sp.]
METPNQAAKRVDRQQTARTLLQVEIEKLPAEERQIVERFVSRRGVARNVLREFDDQRTFGERLADRVATVGGSWSFIFCFLGALVVWMLFNTWVLVQGAFDPYPYILLNLLLSCVAAIQAPIIMMSQKRQSEADRVQAQHDYEVNIKSELEILQVHEKLNALRDSEVAELLDKAGQMIRRMDKIEQRLETDLHQERATD